jgi:hypothetical protein
MSSADEVPRPAPEAGPAPALDEVRRLLLPEADELSRLSTVFEDLRHVLSCCEQLVQLVPGPAPAAGPQGTDADAVLVEALWTSALLAYARCFSAETQVLSSGDLDGLELPGDVGGFHSALLRLRDHYASQHVNPRESVSVGAAVADGSPVGVAVVSAPQPSVDERTVRQLGHMAYRLSSVLDARMQEVQDQVLGRARGLDPEDLGALPLMPLRQ